MKHAIQKSSQADLADILRLQQLAFTTVAELLGDPQIQPLQQTLQELHEEHRRGIILKYCSQQGEIIGSIRASMDGRANCHVGKLIVHPEQQSQGIGRRLLEAIEPHFPSCLKFSLFTAETTPHTAQLYQKSGYHIINQQMSGKINMLILEKNNTPPRELNALI